MTGSLRTPLLTALFCISASPGFAQERDAQVLLPGELRFRAGARMEHASERFGESDRALLGAELAGPLTARSFAPLQDLAADLHSFFQSEPGTLPDLADLSLGEFSPEFASSSRVVPLGLSVGILPRIEIGGSVPIYRNERILRRALLSGGNVGLNPATDANAALLARIGTAGEELGGGLLLPLASSALGQELQQRVVAATGEELALPGTPIDITQLLTNFQVEPLPYTLGDWGLGDAELHARVQLVNSLGEMRYPRSAGLHYRAAAYGGIRLPTATSQDPTLALTIGPEAGFGGLQAGGAIDVFRGERFWGTFAADWERLSPSQKTEWPPAAAGEQVIGAEPVTLTRDPGQRIQLLVIPRVRMTQEIALGGILRYESIAEGSAQVGDVTYSLGGGSAAFAGFSVRYSTIASAENGRSILPLEVSAGYTGAVVGSAGSLARGTAFLQIALQPRLWGRAANSPASVEEATP